MQKLFVSSIVSLSALLQVAHASAPEERSSSVRKAIQGATKQAPKELDIVNGFKHMFQDGKISGNIRSLYSGYNNDNETNIYATAVGGQLLYELAKYQGFNAGAAFTTTYDVGFASGDKAQNKRNTALSGNNGSYTELTQAYINYNYNNINLRAGRQLIDTPLADSDDIRMVPNSFEAYTLSYEQDNFSLMLGHIMRWQGYDAGFDNQTDWIDTGKDGVNFVGVTFSNDFLETNLWYYNITNGSDQNGNDAFYFDAIAGYYLTKTIDVHAGVQYLKENELDNSGVAAEIYGATAELIIKGLGINIAYNKSIKQTGKHSFNGYGGGTLFTNMDTMILDEITEDRDAYAWVGGAIYSLNEFHFLYAYGDFKGDGDINGVKAHITEQNIGADYSPNDDLTVGAIYVIETNKEDSSSTFFNDTNFRVLVSYNF